MSPVGKRASKLLELLQAAPKGHIGDPLEKGQSILKTLWASLKWQWKHFGICPLMLKTLPSVPPNVVVG